MRRFSARAGTRSRLLPGAQRRRREPASPPGRTETPNPSHAFGGEPVARLLHGVFLCPTVNRRRLATMNRSPAPMRSGVTSRLPSSRRCHAIDRLRRTDALSQCRLRQNACRAVRVLTDPRLIRCADDGQVLQDMRRPIDQLMWLFVACRDDNNVANLHRKHVAGHAASSFPFQEHEPRCHSLREAGVTARVLRFQSRTPKVDFVEIANQA